ncbi:hypothetical protein SEA_PHAYONCE_37 [Mycobacterium phage Phayonce]|uniref:Uncharacterized protein n=1 Tax=Mycobacterium phage Phayonce TaxID=1647302 RepID=A0A0F6SJK9_9CAUD|nr:hypothetical protein SEA_PHAYONCE_37 [Mycobacterium phage Phayonce]AKF14397.1 hypothetical protein SEA_PHAYONCE_37 [Mycobacterium phage Phayonce]
MSDEPYAIRVLQRVDALFARAQRALADQPDAAATIANLHAIHRGVSETAAAQSIELEQFVRASHDAEQARAELQVRVDELQSELDELRGGLAEGIAQAVTR